MWVVIGAWGLSLKIRKGWFTFSCKNRYRFRICFKLRDVLSFRIIRYIKVRLKWFWLTYCLFNGFIGSGTTFEQSCSSHDLIKSPACRSVSDLVQLFKPAERVFSDDDLPRSSPACRSVSNLVKLFEHRDKSLNELHNLHSQKSKTTANFSLENFLNRL